MANNQVPLFSSAYVLFKSSMLYQLNVNSVSRFNLLTAIHSVLYFGTDHPRATGVV